MARERQARRRLLVWIAAAVGAIGHEAGNNQPLDLLRAFINLENFGVAHELFHGVPGKMLQKVSAGSASRAVLAVEAVATKNLKSMQLGISERGLGFCSCIYTRAPERRQARTSWRGHQREPWQWRRSRCWSDLAKCYKKTVGEGRRRTLVVLPRGATNHVQIVTKKHGGKL